MATLLCSILLGSGFNAFVVHGLAKEQVAANDQSQQPCSYSKLSTEAAQVSALAMDCLTEGEQGVPSKEVFSGKTAVVSRMDISSEAVPDLSPDGSVFAVSAQVDGIPSRSVETATGTAAVEDTALTTSSSATAGEGACIGETAPLPTAETANPASAGSVISESKAVVQCIVLTQLEDDVLDYGHARGMAPQDSLKKGSAHAWVLVKANRKVTLEQQTGNRLLLWL